MDVFGDGSLASIEIAVSARGPNDAFLGIPVPGTTEYVIEKRNFNRILRDPVPARDTVTREPLFLYEFREQKAGPLCWREGRFGDRISRYPYYLVLRYYELWQVNATRRDYYDTILGPEVTVTTGVADAAALTARWLGPKYVGVGQAGAAAGAAEAGGGAAAGLAAEVGVLGGTAAVVGVGVTFFIATTAGVRLLDDGFSRRIAAGWEIIHRVQLKKPVVTEGEPYWQRVTPLYECQSPETVIAGDGDDDVSAVYGPLAGERREVLDGVTRLTSGTTLDPKSIKTLDPGPDR